MRPMQLRLQLMLRFGVFQSRQGRGGFSLIEVLVVTGIAGIIVSVLASSEADLFKAVRSVTQSQDVQSLVSGIDLFIKDNKSCTSLFNSSGVQFQTWGAVCGQPILIKKLAYGGVAFADVDNILGKIQTTSIQLVDLNTNGGAPFSVMVNTAPPLAPPTYVPAYRYLAELDINYTKAGETVGGGPLPVKKFYFTLDLLASNNTLFGCYGGIQNDFFQEICQRQLGGTYDPSKQPSCLLNQITTSDSFANRDAQTTSFNNLTSGIGLTTTGGIYVNPNGAPGPGVGPTLNGIYVQSNAQSQLALFGPSENIAGQGSYAVEYFGRSDFKTNGPAWAIGYRLAPCPQCLVFEYRNAPNGGDWFSLDPTNLQFRFSNVSTLDFLTGNFFTQGSIKSNLAITSLDKITGSQVISTGNMSTGGNLAVTGNITAGGTVTAASDERLKKEITPVQNALKKAMDLKAVSFRWRDPLKGPDRHYGFVAQEVEKIDSDLVHTDSTGVKSIAYLDLTAIFAAALQEEVQKSDKRQKEIEVQLALDHEKIRVLTEYIDQLKVEIQDLKSK